MSGDFIGQYLAELRARLRTPDAALVIAEAEDHLRESVAAGLAAGLTEPEAQQAALSAFGSVRAVVRAHRMRYWKAVLAENKAVLLESKAVLAENVAMAVLKLACICLYAVAAAGVLALIQDLAVSRAFVAEDPTGTRYSLSKCLYWMKDNPGAHTCAQAAMLEGSGDIVVLGGVGAIFGTLLLEGYFLVRYIQRKRGVQMPVVLPSFAFPAVAVTAFGGLAVWLAAHAALRAIQGGGPGALLGGAVVCAAVATWYLPRLRRGLAAEGRMTDPLMSQ